MGTDLKMILRKVSGKKKFRWHLGDKKKYLKLARFKTFWQRLTIKINPFHSINLLEGILGRQIEKKLNSCKDKIF